MYSILLALGGLSALVAASPVATPAPKKRTPAEKRQDDDGYSSCTFSQTVFTNVNQWGFATATQTQDVCSCAGDLYPSFSTSTSVGTIGDTTVLEICYDATTYIHSSSSITTSVFPSVVANAVKFGDQNPSWLVENLGTKCLGGACPPSGTIEATYIPTTMPTTIFSGTTIVENVAPTPLIIKWAMDADTVTPDDYGTYFGALSVLADLNGTNTFGPFNYWGEALSVNDPAPHGVGVTQYQGPGQVGISRYDYPQNIKNAMEHLNIFFSSEIIGENTGATCADIEGPLASVLGLIPDFGAFFGILGSVLCDETAAATPTSA